MGSILTVGPNEALVISGGCCGGKSRIIGGWAWAWWLISDVQTLSLEIMTIKPKCDYVETAQGVPLTVTGIAQCKVMTDDEFLIVAAEQFLGKSISQVRNVLIETLEGHLRAILGTLSVEEIYRDRDRFAQLVREVATPDVGRMGIEIVSFTIKDVFDSVEYLSSLGRARTAEVKRDARAGVAIAEKEAGIKESEANKQAMDVKYVADTKIEDGKRMYSLQKANFDQEVNTKKAEAELAYELQSAKVQQSIRAEEMEIEVVERRKLIDVEEKEILRKDKELISKVKQPADSEAYRLEMIAKGMRTQKVAEAEARAQRTKLIGSSEAYAIEAVGKAEAESMRLKAEAYKQYGDAAILALTLEALPKVAAQVAAPLAKTDQIVLLGDTGNTVDAITQMVTQIPPAIQALTGINLTGVLGKIPGAVVQNQPMART